MQSQVHPVHFEDFSGTQFERLCFAYLLRRPDYAHVDWYGQLGKDRGRDIVCDNLDGKIHICQCANYRRLTERKAREDLEMLATGPRSKDARFLLIAGGGVSGALKDKVRALATTAGFSTCQTWSGPEFEERLRRDAPDLLLRFTSGLEFPELRAELAAFAADPSNMTPQLSQRSPLPSIARRTRRRSTARVHFPDFERRSRKRLIRSIRATRRRGRSSHARRISPTRQSRKPSTGL